MVLENDDAWRHSALARRLRGASAGAVPYGFARGEGGAGAQGGGRRPGPAPRASIPCWPGWRLAGWCRWPGRRKHSGVWLDCVFLTYKDCRIIGYNLWRIFRQQYTAVLYPRNFMTQARRPASTIRPCLPTCERKFPAVHSSRRPSHGRGTGRQLLAFRGQWRAKVLAVLERSRHRRRIPNKGAVVAHVDMQWVYFADCGTRLDGDG